MIFTTSWDDGDISDYQLLELMSPLGIKGTLYIPQMSGHRFLKDIEVKELSNYFEIGAHSMTHQNLTNASNFELEFEISGSKNYIESITGKKCEMFAFPYGLFNDKIDTKIRESGFLGARIVNQDFCEGSILHNIHLPTTLQVCKHTKQLTVEFNTQPSNKNSLSRQFLDNIQTFKVDKNDEYNWLEIAIYVYYLVKQQNGIFHLWGHSWEIGQQDLWDDLKAFLSFVAEEKNIIYKVNSELFK